MSLIRDMRWVGMGWNGLEWLGMAWNGLALRKAEEKALNRNKQPTSPKPVSIVQKFAVFLFCFLHVYCRKALNCKIIVFLAKQRANRVSRYHFTIYCICV